MTGLPRLSVVCITNGPIPMVAAALARVRDVASEVVVAVDARVDPETLGPLDVVADRVLRAEYMTPFEANLSWLDSLATGDWVLQLDGDDVVSDALLARLSTPGWDDGITHARLSYRWCWPSPDRMLDELPWRHNAVLRLFRATPGITSYQGLTHTGRDVVGHSRRFDEPLYHLTLLATDRATRAAKAEEYERSRPGLRTQYGWAVNPAFYLPEDLNRVPRTTSVSESDAAAIEAILDADGSETQVRSRGVNRGEVITTAARRAPRPVAGDVVIRSLDHQPVDLIAGRDADLTVGLTNHSGRRLSPNDTPPTIVDARLVALDGTPMSFHLWAVLSGPVASDDEIVLPLQVRGDLPIGSHVFEVGAFQPGGDRYDASCVIAIDVRSSRRLLLVAPSTADTAEIRAVLALAAPDLEPVSVDRDGPLPDGWPNGFEAVVVSDGPLLRRAPLRRAARRAGVPVFDGSGWLKATAEVVRAELASGRIRRGGRF